MEESSEEDPYLAQQKEALRFWEEKTRREAEDAKLVKEMQMNELIPPVGVKDENEDFLLALKFQEEEDLEAQRRAELRDTEFVRRMQEEEVARLEEQRKAAEADVLYVQRLVEEEKIAAEREDAKREWENTMNLIRSEAKLESDTEVARLVHEKQELEDRLRQIQSNSGDQISLADCDYPADWQQQRSPHQSFDVVKNSAEWNRINGHFKSGIPGAQIHRIERNQNKELWMWYWLKKKEIAKRNKNMGANEQLGYHGSRNDAYDIILSQGFDHRVAAMTGAIGAGVYFAVASSTSNGYMPGKQSQWKKMLFCRIILGDMGPGKSGLRRPPDKPGGGIYDSVGREGTMWVVFDNYQAYPEYVIHYTG